MSDVHKRRRDASIHRLTARVVEQAKAPGLYPDGGGLYLQVTIGADGAPRRSWLLRFNAPDGRRREMGLGSSSKMDLAAARTAAKAARKLADEGFDPIEARDAAKANAAAERARAVTFRECAEAYITAHAPSWKNAKHRAQWSSTLESYAYPTFGDVDVRNIDIAMIMKILDPIWQTKTETASRLRGRIESILDWATVRNYRKGENPARWRGHLQKALPAPKKSKRVRHHPALPFVEIGDFVSKLRAHAGLSARALEFAILTAARTGETIGASWDEVDLESGVWTIPAERMKAGREHRVSLSKAALKILQGLHEPRGRGPIFVNPRTSAPLSDMALLMTLRRISGRDLTVHGFRSTFRDWAAERTDFPREVAEAALAHALTDKVEAAYRRGDLFDKRRQLLEAWSEACDTPKASRSA